MTAAVDCPGCGAVLDCTSVAGARRYVCSSCGSEVIGLAVLNRLLPDGEAHRLWTSANQAAGGAGSSGNRCPFCTTSMLDARSAHGHIGMCRRCQMVWLDKVAMADLPGRGDQPKFIPAEVTRCENCGAPLKDSLDGSCSYCGYQVVAPQIVVVADGQEQYAEPAGPASIGWKAASIAGSLLELLVDP